MKIVGPRRGFKLGYRCVYKDKKIYAYAWGPVSILCYSFPEGKKLFEIGRVGGESGYFPGGNFAVIGDINGDGFREIATPEVWAGKELLIFSGKDGSYLRRVRSSGVVFWTPHTTILPSFDHNGDRIDDLLVNGRLYLFLVSGKDFALLRKFVLSEMGLIEYMGMTPDLDGDGREDFLIVRKERGSSSPAFVYLSSSRGKILKSWYLRLRDSNPPRVTGLSGGENAPLILKDLDGDSFPEVVLSASEKYTFEGTTYTGNILVCFSSLNGKEIWRIKGWKLTRKESLAFSFASRITYPDLNGDNIEEIIVAYRGEYIKENDPVIYLLIFSGKDGRLLGKKRIEEIRSCSAMLYEIIPDMDGDGRGEILLGATDYNGEGKEDTGGVFVISSRLLTS